jgi:DNA-binding ferritin-like protein (Dps family)
MIDFPEREEERMILKENLPFADEQILDYITDFLQAAHEADERYTARDGINIARFAIKLIHLKAATDWLSAVRTALRQTLGEEALRYVRQG